MQTCSIKLRRSSLLAHTFSSFFWQSFNPISAISANKWRCLWSCLSSTVYSWTVARTLLPFVDVAISCNIYATVMWPYVKKAKLQWRQRFLKHFVQLSAASSGGGGAISQTVHYSQQLQSYCKWGVELLLTLKHFPNIHVDLDLFVSSSIDFNVTLHPCFRSKIYNN